MRWGYGTLQNCSNSSLDNVGIRFAAPYEAKDPKDNVTRLSGTFMGNWRNSTREDDDDDGGESAAVKPRAVWQWFLIAAALGSGFMLL